MLLRIKQKVLSLVGKKLSNRQQSLERWWWRRTLERGGALVVRPQASLVPAPVNADVITPISGAEMASTKGSEEDTISVIRIKVAEIDKVLKGTLAQQKAASKKKEVGRKAKKKEARKVTRKSRYW